MVKMELSQKTSAIEKIKRLIKLEFEFIERNRDFFRIYISERNRFEWTIKDDLGKGIHDKMVAYIKDLSQVMKQGMREGELKPTDPMDLAHALVGIFNSFVFEWLISPQPYPLISKMEAVLEIFFKGAQRKERRQ